MSYSAGVLPSACACVFASVSCKATAFQASIRIPQVLCRWSKQAPLASGVQSS